ncbi:MAG: DUF3846 domain-containing protein [Lachnospiraceae bacterium]|nr:DUF3846 domain-containing protein [Lachnospiraceae bacterium]
MKKSKINAYLLRVDEMSGDSYKGYIAEVENDLKTEQLFVNYNQAHGLIQVIRLNEHICAVINDEGKLKNFHINRLWLDEDGKVLDFIVGNIMCVRYGEEGEFASILPSDVAVIEKILVPVVRKEFMKEWH